MSSVFCSMKTTVSSRKSWKKDWDKCIPNCTICVVCAVNVVYVLKASGLYVPRGHGWPVGLKRAYLNPGSPRLFF